MLIAIGHTDSVTSLPAPVGHVFLVNLIGIVLNSILHFVEPPLAVY
jgi:hypothetical protein